MRVLICDDQALIREGLRVMLELEDDIAVVGLAASGEEAVLLAAEHQPDLVLMDLKMPKMNGVEATRLLRADLPQVRTIVLTTYSDDTWLFDAIRAGAVGYVLKDTPRAELITVLREVAAGRYHIDPTLMGAVFEHIARPEQQPASLLSEKLSERELAILGLLSSGRTNAAIAEQLHLSEGTVRNYVSAILTKLEVSDRTQAAVIGRRHGLHTT